MEKMLLSLSLLLFIIGILFRVLTYGHRTAEHPDIWKLSSYSPKNWKPFWLTANWYDATGFRYQCISVPSIVVGAVLYLFYLNIY